jgi:hypothetical protein
MPVLALLIPIVDKSATASTSGRGNRYFKPGPGLSKMVPNILTKLVTEVLLPIIGDELTFGYTYENSGPHGFLHTPFGEHTESAGVMKNFALPRTTIITGYTWLQSGLTSYTGKPRVANRLDSGVSLGAIIHFNNANSVWIQESYSKVVTVPWYTTTSFGYTYSW